MRLQRPPGLNWVLPSFHLTFYRILKGFYRVLPSFTGFDRVLLKFLGCRAVPDKHRVLPTFRLAFYLILPSFTGFERVFTEFYRVLPGFIVLRVFVECTGIGWVSKVGHGRVSLKDLFCLLDLFFFDSFFFLGCDADVASASTCSWRSSTTAAAGSSWWRHRTTTASRAIRSADCRSSASRTGASTQFSFSVLFFFLTNKSFEKPFSVSVLRSRFVCFTTQDLKVIVLLFALMIVQLVSIIDLYWSIK